jgi:hypothetical protein
MWWVTERIRGGSKGGRRVECEACRYLFSLRSQLTSRLPPGWQSGEALCRFLASAHVWISDSCEDVVRWLMGVDPGGFKLNENLNRAIGCCVLCLLTLWRAILHAALLFLPPAQRTLTLLSYGCLLGASVGIAITSDLIALLSFHVVQVEVFSYQRCKHAA